MKKPLLLIPLFTLAAIFTFSIGGQRMAFAEPEDESVEISSVDSESIETESSSEELPAESVSSEEEPALPAEDEPAEPAEEVEENDKLDLIAELEKKINELKNKQFLGTTVGAIIGSAIALLTSLGFSLLNRNNLLKVGELTTISRGYVADVKDLYKEVKADFKEACKELKDVKNELNEARLELEEQMKSNEQLKEMFEEAKADFEQEKELLLTIIASDKELVSNGKAQEIIKKYGL